MLLPKYAMHSGIVAKATTKKVISMGTLRILWEK